MATAKLIRGDTWRRSWIIKDETGQPIDLTGASARLQVRDKRDEVLAYARMDNGMITIDPLQGRIDMVVPASITKDFPIASHRFDLELTFADGTVRTIEQSTLQVIEDVTHD